MEVKVEASNGFPEGSILSIRAGQVRRQGNLSVSRSMQFPTTPLEANPFKIDVFAPLASTRLTLTPTGSKYSVSMGPDSLMKLDLSIQKSDNTRPSESREARRSKATLDTQDYIQEHQLVEFVQNLMQSVLAERPVDPFKYMEGHLKAARSKSAGRPSSFLHAHPASRVRHARAEGLEPTRKSSFGPSFVVQDRCGATRVHRELLVRDVLPVGVEFRRLTVPHLSDRFPVREMRSPLPFKSSNDQWVLQNFSHGAAMYQMLVAGPRNMLHFDPKEVTAAIVTCGGLCPGLNAVIRELVVNLHMYGVKKIYGVRGGFNGVVKPDTWMDLTSEVVRDIHMKGGTILKSDRGNPPEDEMAQVLKTMKVRQFFILGGDGTHRCALATYEATSRLHWECAVVGIPKTIDNDIPLLDKTFGFDTATTEARKAIESAYIEATCNEHCIGLVKLMGRHSGFITGYSCFSVQTVDICLLPEMNINLEKLLEHTLHLMQTKGYAVIVVAEGCGDTILKCSNERDAGGNKKLADVGTWLKDQILAKFKQVRLPLTIKYIDPTYMVRAVPQNACDSVYCSVLAQNAVHTAMAGYTGVTIGKILQWYTVLPICAVTHLKPKKVDLKSEAFFRLMASTQQPNLQTDAVVVPESRAVDPMLALSHRIELLDVLKDADEVRRLELEHLSERFGVKKVTTTYGMTVHCDNFLYQDEQSWVTQTLLAGTTAPEVRMQMLRAGARRNLFFEPREVAAAIVVCGGVCPGVNSVIREIVMMLYNYGVRKVYGVKGGFGGVVDTHLWSTLTPDSVREIHTQGGAVLVCDTGTSTATEMAAALRKKGVRQFFVIGGMGAHQGAQETCKAIEELVWECAVIGIPKTIDNDIALLDRTFGFNTACTEAKRAIDAAYMEATCHANCVSVVKLMGRHCGFLVTSSCLAAHSVDICLLPEMDVQMDTLFGYAVDVVRRQGYAVIVVAEGCVDTLCPREVHDVGMWLKDALLCHFDSVKQPLFVNYVDPTCMIRAVPANANDSIYCADLAYGAVHAAMAGYTATSVVKVDETFVYLPMRTIAETPSRYVDVKGPLFERLLASTQQPDLGPHRPPEMSNEVKRRIPPANGDEVLVAGTLTMLDGYGRTITSRPLRRADLIHEKDSLRQLRVFHLGDQFGKQHIVSSLRSAKFGSTPRFQDESSWCTQAFCSKYHARGTTYFQMVQAGPREKLHFDPHDPTACAAIVTCGGICPGLNSVIREVVNTLWAYGVRRIFGIRGGFKGTTKPESWTLLTPDDVAGIHMQGGTMLVTDRGHPDHKDMATALRSQSVRQYFVLGGDGTHRCAMKTFEECIEIGHECAVVGVPKTIDNDVPIVDQTFGFDTACAEAMRAVESAYVEATCNSNCIGLVKLMGRHCGFISLNACLAEGHVDICLLPEMEVNLENVLDHTVQVMQSKGHAVIVVAEGCGDTLIKSTGERDAGGNKKLADVGMFLQGRITERFKKLGMPLAIKFIDPTYLIRSVPPSSFDSVYCSVLAQSAVHGAMAGFSGITVGKVNECFVYLPIGAITSQGKRVDVHGRWFSRLTCSTRQPSFAPLVARVSGASAQDLDTVSDVLSINQVLESGDEVRRLELVNLRSDFPPAMIANPLSSSSFLDENAWTTQTLRKFNRRDNCGHAYLQTLRAGPREFLHFNPLRSKAIIVTCGGLCPGLNSVIREIVMVLRQYGVQHIYGCKGGYKGMVQPSKWMSLDEDKVRDIHLQGGSILVADRGNPPHCEIARVLRDEGVKQCFVLGGDGTQKGAMGIFQESQTLKHEIAVVGIPKTIDNDVPLLDRSFGFNTACSEAVRAIDAAHVEATCGSNCIGLVKLMGRHCGFIALEATLAARYVDVVLVPEMRISLPKVLNYIHHLMSTKRHAVIVVAEGCGDTLIESSGVDAGGNKKLADVGPWLRDQIYAYLRKMHHPVTIRYIDPTYMIRAVPANTNDSIYCTVLGQSAAHAAMAGYTGITVGKVDERFVMLPIHAITNVPSRRVDLKSAHFDRLMHTTKQPDFTPGPGDEWALLPQPPKSSVKRSLGTVPPPEVEILEWKRRYSKAHWQGADPQEISVNGSVLKTLDGRGKVLSERTVQREDLLQTSAEVRRLEVMCLSEKFPSKHRTSPLRVSFNEDESWSVQAFSLGDRVDTGKGTPYFQMLRAGPRKFLHFDPLDGCAVIVASGGLCPGMNSVIRELTMMMYAYGVQRVHGVCGGFVGLSDREQWMELTPGNVFDIHAKGGSILESEAGNPQMLAVVDVLVQNEVRQLFVLGGDGAHRGALQVLTELLKCGWECAVVAVPKSVDNDIPLMDQTFGFETACTEAKRAIDAAYVEATCNANCIGLVKLMGQYSGFIALHAALASQYVDICLLPEMDVCLSKVLDHCEAVMATKGHVVVVVSEGCGPSFVRHLGSAEAAPVAPADVGTWLKDQIMARFQETMKPLTVKYIDPTFMIRSVPANAQDAVLSSCLAQHAVHGAMAGYTGITVVKNYERFVYLPIHAVTRTPRKRVNTSGRWFARLIFSTQQPPFEPDGLRKAQSEDKLDLREFSTAVSLETILMPGDQVHRLELTNVGASFPSRRIISALKHMVQDANFFATSSSAWSTQTFQSSVGPARTYLQMMRSGPREVLHFDPREPEAAAAIVTCGGVCPGLNSVIREVVKTLHMYGVSRVFGIVGGFKGCVEEEQWVHLTDERVQDIHQQGGTILVTDRGNPPHAEMAKVLAKRKVRQYFVLGGTGTHRGAQSTFREMQALRHECSVVCIPKTIENDIPLIDKSFGFDTACTEAAKAINSAYVEATTNANCLGLVKLMGRHCGFIALHATLAARHVDVCLIPEMPVFRGKVLDYVAHVMQKKGYAVIVAAEGCGDTGLYWREEIATHFKKVGLPLSIKYIDPTYMIRSVAANASDNVYCALLAQQAVHAAMAGYSDCTVGKVDERFVTLPIHAITQRASSKVDINGRLFERLIMTTGQPSFV